jgi:hypothetical protein
MKWVVQAGCPSRGRTVATSGAKDANRCAVPTCGKLHNDPVMESENEMYSKWVICARCARWYAASCLGWDRARYAEVEGGDVNYECKLYADCKVQKKGYECEEYKAYKASLAGAGAAAAARATRRYCVKRFVYFIFVLVLAF